MGLFRSKVNGSIKPGPVKTYNNELVPMDRDVVRIFREEALRQSENKKTLGQLPGEGHSSRSYKEAK